MVATDGSKKTPLYDLHKAAKAKMVPFGGWLMPVSYTSVLNEHEAVRQRCGIFDVSHMGELIVKGRGAADFLQKITMNDLNRLQDGQGQYSAFLYPTGGMVDDIILYRLKEDAFFICVNASNTEKDYDWVKQQLKRLAAEHGNFRDIELRNESTLWSQIAVQGPNSHAALEALLSADQDAKSTLKKLDYMSLMSAKLFGQSAYIARTGYTGEWGYELYLPNSVAPSCWEALLATHPQTGVQAIGLGARDTLRLEACYLLYGNDMNDEVSPLEAGVAWAVRLDKPDFIGKDALVKQKEFGTERSAFAFQMEGDGIPRHDMLIYKNDELIGKVTSGSVLPTVGGAGGMALLNPKKVHLGEQIEVDVRGKRKLARVVKKPLYKAKVKG